ncbi:MAG: type II toxin-antitoxin system prevent-host-death family antitoxin [Pseudomonadota bacterium]
MTDQFTIAEAKNRLPALVHSVEKGPAVKLTRHGRPVAVLLSLREYDRLNRKKGDGYWHTLAMLRQVMEREDAFISDGDLSNLREETPGRAVDF